jgi:hypothetical protein
MKDLVEVAVPEISEINRAKQKLGFYFESEES